LERALEGPKLLFTVLLHEPRRPHGCAEAYDAIPGVITLRGVEREKVAFLSFEVETDGSRPLFDIVEDSFHVLLTAHYMNVIHVRGEEGRGVLLLKSHQDWLKGRAKEQRA
jgi:hypothetical protein